MDGRRTDTSIIDQYDVAVIGGGVTGCAAAHFLSQEGASVALIERYDLNTEASGRNAGGLHGQIQYPPFVGLGEAWAKSFRPALTLMRESLRLWSTLEAELGTDLEVKIGGGVLIAENTEQLRLIHRKATLERAFGSEVHVLSRQELFDLAPYVSDRMVGGMFCELEGKANPLLAGPAFARSARRRGADILLRTPVRAIERIMHGFRLITETGEVRARRVIDCGGAGAGRISELVGVPLPIQDQPIQVTVTEPVAPLIQHLLYFAGKPLTLKQSKTGTLLIGGGWPSRRDSGGRLMVDVGSLRGNLSVAISVVPSIASAQIIRTWPGICPGLPDQLPILGELQSVPGFYVAMFPDLGFTCGPILGKIVSDLALGRRPDVDISNFSPNRLHAA